MGEAGSIHGPLGGQGYILSEGAGTPPQLMLMANMWGTDLGLQKHLQLFKEKLKILLYFENLPSFKCWKPLQKILLKHRGSQTPPNCLQVPQFCNMTSVKQNSHCAWLALIHSSLLPSILWARRGFMHLWSAFRLPDTSEARDLPKWRSQPYAAVRLSYSRGVSYLQFHKTATQHAILKEGGRFPDFIKEMSSYWCFKDENDASSYSSFNQIREKSRKAEDTLCLQLGR